ncbi:MAG TPA: transcriptional regulator [Cyanobacteria bacterium UBA8803]|nr:transcriptional regulator [Cyanobacteria bacterium UBA9273]HBL60977.1 transcriptional regulator [Cyanobacteria bacterium UBA8803]
MIHTSSPKNYADLLIQYQPKPIKTEPEYQQFLAIVEGMMSSELTDAETTLFDLLVLIIENYEAQHYPMSKPTIGTRLESLMHEFDVKPTTLVDIIGSLELVREIINGQRGVSKSQAESLAKFFNDLSPGLGLTAKDFGELNASVEEEREAYCS